MSLLYYLAWGTAPHYEYRKDPVPYTRKIKGGPRWSSPHTVKIKKLYSIPEYKCFNRGSIKKLPSWWDDRSRDIQKCWKKQRKVRHQWQKK